MTVFSLSEPKGRSVWALYRIRDRIDMDPLYQREGEIWDLGKRQLLIDTILNGFDVPKIYFHKFPEPRILENGTVQEYAVVDGKQRLNAIWSFINGEFNLGDEITYIRDETINLKGLTYSELASEFPEIKQYFDSWPLDIVAIETDDIEIIEDLFSRLNEAMPLNAAEKRNAYRGPLPAVVRRMATHRFFVNKVPFTNSRYRHFDVISKVLYTVYEKGIVDTKKAYIDNFFKSSRDFDAAAVEEMEHTAIEVLDAMSDVFIDNDPLLRQVGMAIIYFHVFSRAIAQGELQNMRRVDFQAFEDTRAENKRIAAEDIAAADYDLLEFNRYTQWPNDGIAMRFRLGVMDLQLFDRRLGFA